MKFILKRGEIREKLWTKNQYYAYNHHIAKKKPVLKTILIKFNATFYVKDYCKVSGHNMLYFRKYSHFLSEIMILYLYKKNKYNQKSSVFEYN